MKRLILILIMGLAGTAGAQDTMSQTGEGDPETTFDGYIKLLRSDLKASKVEVITEVMAFTDEQASAFWPIYREYDAELTKLGDARLALIKDYAAVYESVTDEQAEELMNRSLAIHDDRAKLRKTYWKQFKKALPATLAARFLQLEHQIELLVDLQIASEIPLIE